MEFSIKLHTIKSGWLKVKIIQKILLGTLSEFLIVWIQIRMQKLIWVQTVWKRCQQMKKVAPLQAYYDCWA